MLILSRRENQVVKIADIGTVKVLEVRGNSVRLGFEFPADVAIHREEIWVETEEQKQAADAA